MSDRGMQIEECEAETEVGSDGLDRALALLAKWACRRGRRALKDALPDPHNRVTADSIKGYGAQNADN